MTRGKASRPPPLRRAHTHTCTQRRTHSVGTGWRGILEKGMWTDGEGGEVRAGGTRQNSPPEKSRGGRWGQERWPYWFWSTSTPARCLATMLTTLRHSCAQAGRWKFNLGSGGGARVSRCIFRLTRFVQILFYFFGTTFEVTASKKKSVQFASGSSNNTAQFYNLLQVKFENCLIACKSCPLLFLNKHLPVKHWQKTDFTW